MLLCIHLFYMPFWGMRRTLPPRKITAFCWNTQYLREFDITTEGYFAGQQPTADSPYPLREGDLSVSNRRQHSNYNR